MRTVSHRRPIDPRTLGRVLAVVGALGVLLGPAGVAAAVAPMDVPYSATSSGNVEVTFPSTYPDVQLSVVGNQTVASDLAINQILESTASASAPQILAVALPSDIVVTNATGGTHAGGRLVSVSADLTVYPSNAGLWQGPGDLVQPNGAPLGTAQLAINYSLAPSTSASHGVSVAWRVAGWPWVAASDLLGVQFSLSTPLAKSQIACTGSPSSIEQVGCPGTPLAVGSSVWGSDLLGVQGRASNGPTALVSWGSGVATSAGPASPVSAGVLAATPTFAHLLVAAPGNGAPVMSGNLSFALLSVTPGISAPLLVHAASTWYFAGLAASALGGLGGLLAYRRRQRGIERDL